MIETLVVSLLAGSTKQASTLLIDAFKEYLKKRGEKVSETPSEQEISESLKVVEAKEPSIVAVEQTKQVFGNAATQLGAFRVERERQARNSYNLACVVLAAGSVLVLAGVGWMGFGNSLQPGMVTSAVGAITSLCSGAIFKFSKDANDRLDDSAQDLHRIEVVRVALDAVQKITNEAERNAAINQLATNLANVRNTQKVRKSRTTRGVPGKSISPA